MDENAMIGRHVRAIYGGIAGTAIRWQPLGAAMCDVLVRESSGRECWYGSSDLRPTDGLGPLPSRAEAQASAERASLASLTKIRADLADEIRTGRPWPGAEHGKAILGRAIDGAIADTKARRR